jgi:hypothetical protein
MSNLSNDHDTLLGKRSPAKSTYSELFELGEELSDFFSKHMARILDDSGSKNNLPEANLCDTTKGSELSDKPEDEDEVNQPAKKQSIDTFYASERLKEIDLKTLDDLMKDPNILDDDWNLKHEISLRFLKACFSVNQHRLQDEWTSDDTKKLKADIEKCTKEACLRTTEMLRNSYMLFMTYIPHMPDSVTSTDKKKSEQSISEIDKNEPTTIKSIWKNFGIYIDDNTLFGKTIKDKERITLKRLKDLVKSLGSQNHERAADLDNLDGFLAKFDNYLDLTYKENIESKFDVFKKEFENRLLQGVDKSNKGKTIRPRNLMRADNTITEVKIIIKELRDEIQKTQNLNNFLTFKKIL